MFCCSANAPNQLFGLCVADVIDIDTERHKRRYGPIKHLYSAKLWLTKYTPWVHPRTYFL